MKKTFFITLLFNLFLLSQNPILGQNKETPKNGFQIRTGYGYFQSGGITGSGEMLLSEVGYQLNKNVSLGIGLGFGSTLEDFDNGIFFAGEKFQHTFLIWKAFVERQTKLPFGVLIFGTGLLFQVDRKREPFVAPVPGTDFVELGISDNSFNRDIGITFNATYEINVFRNFYFGLRGESYIHTASDSFESFILAPVFAVRF